MDRNGITGGEDSGVLLAKHQNRFIACSQFDQLGAFERNNGLRRSSLGDNERAGQLSAGEGA